MGAQQNISRSTILKINRADTFKCSAKERRRNERIANLVAGYTRDTDDDFLRGIAKNYDVHLRAFILYEIITLTFIIYNISV